MNTIISMTIKLIIYLFWLYISVKEHDIHIKLCWNYGSLLEWWLYYWNDGYTIEKVAHYWNGGYTIEIVAILLKMWLTIGMVASLLEWWLYY